MEYLKLNKKELSFLEELKHIYTEKEFQEQILEMRKLKTFLKELKKVEKKHGYEPIKTDTLGAVKYFGFDHYEVIEEYIYCFEDMGEASQRYFETYY